MRALICRLFGHRIVSLGPHPFAPSSDVLACTRCRRTLGGAA